MPKSKKITLSYLQSIIGIGSLLFLDIIFVSIFKHNIPLALISALGILIASAVLSLFSMVVKRVITTRWGNFIHGIYIFSFIQGIKLLFLAFLERSNLIIEILLCILGIIFFLIHEKYVIFTKEKKQKEKKKTGKSITQRIDFKNKINKIFNNFKSYINKSKEVLKKIPVNKKIAIPITAGLIVLFVLYKIFITNFCVRVISYSPKGDVPLKTTIRVKFSEKVSLMKEDIIPINTGSKSEYSNVSSISNMISIKPEVSYFKIDPPIKGVYWVEDNDTIIFVPDTRLKPSTEYCVKVITKRIKKEKKIVLGKKFKFNTPQFKVTGANIFYNYDLVKNIEKEVIGEINFNCAVDIEKLKTFVNMELDGKPVKIEIEPSNIPTRFYIKSGRIKRKDYKTSVKLTVSSGLPCIGGERPLKKDFKKVLKLPETVKLTVIRAETFPVVGNTYVSVLFNRPISPGMVRRYVKIKSSEDIGVSYKVETEYCYAVLKADFKPNQKYKLSVSSGMRAKTGEELVKKFEQVLSIRDMAAEVQFASKGRILPLSGNLDMEIYTLNLDKFNVNVNKVFKNNLVYFLRDSYGSSYTKSILYKSVQVREGKLNEKVPHFINLKKLHRMEYKGLYEVKVSDPEEYHNYNKKYILCTDLGIMAKHSGRDLVVSMYSIMGLSPLSGVRVKLVSYKNQVIKEGTTDESGKYIFKDWQINKYEFDPYIVLAEKGEDFSFLKFNETELNHSRFNTGGEIISHKGLKAFLTPERGVYRPGDKAYITAIVRKSDLSLPPPVNVQLYISDPIGEKYKIIRKKIPSNGIMPFKVFFPAYAKTGEYSIILRLNENVVLGRTSLKVEDFIPDKIKAEVKIPKKLPKPGEPVVFTVKSVQLFGPPAAGRKLVTQIKFVSRIFTHPKFRDYTFNDVERGYSGEFLNLGESKLNDKGEKAYTVDVPQSILPPSALKAKIYTEVYDIGGRPVSAVKDVNIDRYSIYIGLKLSRRDVYLKNRPVKVSYAAISPQGKYKKLKDIRILVKHKVHYTILKRHGLFDSRYESDSYEEVILHKNININGRGSFSFTPKAPGEHSIYIGNDRDMRTSKRIYVYGTGIETLDMEKGENLVIELNKRKYNTGDIATVNIHSPIPGRLFFYIEREKVLFSKSVMLVNNKATVQFSVPASYTPNVYVSAFVIRKPDPSLSRLPATSIGIKNLEIEPGEKKLNLNIESAENTRSKYGLNVKLRVPSLTSDTGVVLFAVDEGILQITQFKTPDPFSFFYRKRGLQTRLFSIFDFILPNIRAVKLAIGGDGDYEPERRHINPVKAKRVKSVALYSGVLKPGPDGYVNYHFKIPDFNGRLRVMALGASQGRFGSATKYVTVADPIVITPSLPRMFAPGDSIQIPVLVYNKTGKRGKFNITLNIKGPVRIKGQKMQAVSIPNDSEKKVYFHCQAANDAGKAVFTFSAQGAGESSESIIELPIRPARALTTVAKQGAVNKGKSVQIAVPGGFIKFGQKIRFSASPLYITRFLRALDYLVHYPYGCIEQTTSTVFPLIYYKTLAMKAGLFSGRAGSIDYFISEGIKKLEGMQRSDGKFVYWPGASYVNEYSSRYASQFLLEADRMGFDVDPKVIKRIHKALGIDSAVTRGRLDRRDSYKWDDKNMYLLYLKALIGKPDIETMEYLRNKKLKNMDYVDKCRLASSYGFMGDKNTAKKILPSLFKFKYFPRRLGNNFDSVVRRLSLYLITLCEIDPDNQKKYTIAKEIAGLARGGHFGTTQDNVFALKALAMAYKDQADDDIDANIYIDNKLYKSFAGNMNVIKDNNLSGKTISLKNNGDKKLYYNLIAEGTYLSKKIKPREDGIKISREYFNKDGSKLNLSSVVQGQLIVATLTLKVKRKDIDNIIVVDMLPGGFEIENPRIRSREGLGYSPPRSWICAYEDIRDDRLLLFTRRVTQTIKYSYTLRAVTVGEFIIPQVYADAMYDPEVCSVGKEMGKVYVVRDTD